MKLVSVNYLDVIDYSKIKGIILDIDGTLVLNNLALPGAVDAIAKLRGAGIILQFVTNTTGRSPEQLSVMLTKLGFDIKSHEIQTSVSACKYYISTHFAGKSGYLAIPEATKQMLPEVGHTEENPAFVILGDLDYGFNYEVLNRVFNFIRQGAQLIAFHRNPYYFKEGKTWLDSGAFTSALESITQQTAVITGKPSPTLFDSAVNVMGLLKEQVLVVGDDVDSDIQGAKNAELASLLVGTGKFTPEQLSKDNISSNKFISEIKDLLCILDI
ncbi:HAD-IIA family hydrolase [Endozoicomonas sp. SM1973]|uniref:HAD-IIA family hydrolase n=1 Tax=Spartinivicinus marinus TaxID=2994442 RepID=A0A853IEP0_9GAMM|nr:HAD-IIA family hydrolase [Spartinivicinus marinus]MCX4027273.1 HAD-IIA family hydrolase [Spartinivicinus marinus]NYZ67967.1 HAD-IIA family hydrolase [Spartinivicinus marinus]